MTMDDDDFYEEDEPIEDVLKAFYQGAPITWTAPPRCTCSDLPRMSYPYFTACPLHPVTFNTSTTTVTMTRFPA